jgi:hypothetical protein
MRKLALLALSFVVLTGCGVPRGVTVSAPSHANLAIGRSAQLTERALALAVRSDWPMVENGYRFEEATVYSTVLYDQQLNYDRHGGLNREAESVQTGVQVR